MNSFFFIMDIYSNFCSCFVGFFLQIMNGPVNNNFINDALPLNTNVKLQTEQDDITGMISVFLPLHMTEAVISSEHVRFFKIVFVCFAE